ncbi:hypothetical protein CY34DRAFT_793353 [Suillus luteus UH-Slu-Lm8-n1]|uniref:Uncharacterized protein n=1 Tax=Suillus luteus UH-Slu-Lm8-n1 TaxID=930992 RepID=A0A0D0ALM3_9AGAM|nr:hypothetical protein CY34DRAFT_793353 [Suillus luteus UH-Slu-Lm8-n1]
MESKDAAALPVNLTGSCHQLHLVELNVFTYALEVHMNSGRVAQATTTTTTVVVKPPLRIRHRPRKRRIVTYGRLSWISSHQNSQDCGMQLYFSGPGQADGLLAGSVPVLIIPTASVPWKLGIRYIEIRVALYDVVSLPRVIFWFAATSVAVEASYNVPKHSVVIADDVQVSNLQIGSTVAQEKRIGTVASEGNVVKGWEREVFKDCQLKFGCQVNLEYHIGGLKGLFINRSMISNIQIVIPRFSSVGLFRLASRGTMSATVPPLTISIVQAVEFRSIIFTQGRAFKILSGSPPDNVQKCLRITWSMSVEFVAQDMMTPMTSTPQEHMKVLYGAVGDLVDRGGSLSI